MKKFDFLVGWMVAVCLMAGCTDEWIVEDTTGQNEGTPFVIYASSEPDADSRVSFDEDGLSLLWADGDQLVLVDVEDKIKPIYLTAELEAPSKRAAFKADGGVPAGTYYVRNMTGALFQNYESWMTVDLKTLSNNANLNAIDSNYRLSNLSNRFLSGSIEMCAGPIAIEDGQTSIEVNLRHIFTMLKFNITGSNVDDLKSTNVSIGMASPQKAFPTKVWVDDSQKQEAVLPILELASDIRLGSVEELSEMGTLVLPVDLSGQEICFYVVTYTSDPFDDTSEGKVYEIKKTGKDLKPGVCYTVNLDLDTTTPIEIINGQLSTPAHFRALAYHDVAYSSKYTVTQDIDFEGETYIPISAVANGFGSIDGQGHTLSNLNIDWPYDGAGVFSYYAGDIMDLNLQNVTVNGGSYVGALCGRIGYSAGFSNCKLMGNNTISGSGQYVGGLLGGPVGTALNSYMNACSVNATTTVKGKEIVGGLSGRVQTATNCMSEATVGGENHIGGIAGMAEGTFTNCGSSATVTATGNYAGGIIGGANSYAVVGYSAGSANQCYNIGTVTGTDYVGGIIGAGGNDNSVSLSYSTGEVVGNAYVGGISGDGCIVTDCYSISNVTGEDNSTTAGIIGGNFSRNVERCYAAGEISSGYGISTGGRYYEGKYSNIMNCITTSPNLSVLDTEVDAPYVNLTSILDNIAVINGKNVYSTTRTWEGYEHECPIFLWQITGDDEGSDVEIPPFESEEW